MIVFSVHLLASVSLLTNELAVHPGCTLRGQPPHPVLGKAEEGWLDLKSKHDLSSFALQRNKENSRFEREYLRMLTL